MLHVQQLFYNFHFQIPSPSLVPMRPDSSPDITINELHHSPFSHTGSTPEPTEIISKPVSKAPSRRSSYTTGELKIFKRIRCEQGSNLRGQCPLDFKSNSLTTRTSQPVQFTSLDAITLFVSSLTLLTGDRTLRTRIGDPPFSRPMYTFSLFRLPES